MAWISRVSYYIAHNIVKCEHRPVSRRINTSQDIQYSYLAQNRKSLF